MLFSVRCSFVEQVDTEHHETKTGLGRVPCAS